jgi:parallel beta-helix repeat protein
MRLRMLWAVLVSGMLIGFSAPVATAASATLVVDNDGMAVAGNCNATTSTFSSIETAVTAAGTGDTILVCPGNYGHRQIVVDKRLTIMGAAASQPAQSCRARAQESRVFASSGPGGTGAFRITANSVRIIGFLIEGNAGPGIQTASANSGFIIANNWIRNNSIGVYLNADPVGAGARSRIFHNCISNNNLAGAASGNGIYSDQGLRHASIFENTFRHNRTTGILLSAVSAPVKNVSVIGNTSFDDLTFMASFGDRGLLVENNLVANLTASFHDAGSAIYIGGGSDVGGAGSNGVSLIGNTISSDHFAGIAIRGSADNVLIKGNTVRNTTRGIDVNSDAVGSSLVEMNQIHNVGQFGIFLRDVTAENEITDNTISGSGAAGCRDDSSGSGTSGTANDWHRNTSSGSNPAGLCQ